MLKFRNIDVCVSDSVEEWGFEGILTVLERGGLPEWGRLYQALRKNPYGKVAGELEEAISATEGGALGEGIAGLFEMGLKELRS